LQKKQINRFDLYRFQIIPLNRYIHGNLFGGINSVEELIENKNKIFYNIIKHIDVIKSNRLEIQTRIIYNEDDILIYQFAPRKKINIETKDFEDKIIEDWPSFHVIIWNHPDVQIIAIEERKKAFRDTKTVNNTFINMVNDLIKVQQLTIFSEPIFNKEDFWNIINSNKNGIKDIRFDLITPNMASISNVLSDDLKDLAKNTNTEKTTMSIKANNESVLNITKEDSQLSSLVQYASAGGGNISIKIKGLKRRKQTSENVTTLEIDEVEFNSTSINKIKKLIDKLINT